MRGRGAGSLASHYGNAKGLALLGASVAALALASALTAAATLRLLAAGYGCACALAAAVGLTPLYVSQRAVFYFKAARFIVPAGPKNRLIAF